jgi:hypothetical protein
VTASRLGALALTASLLLAGPLGADAQTPTTPPSESGQQPGQTQPGQTEQQQPTPVPPAPSEVQPGPLLQFPIQQPGRPPVTPAAPPTTTIPPWTPPTPPAPSQTNVPAPFPFAAPGAAPAPGVPGFPGYTPAATGLLAPTVTTVRGALLEFHPTARASLEYSDNFFQTESHAEDNFRSIFGPGFTLLLNGARTFGSFSTSLDLVHDTAPDTGNTIKFFPSFTGVLRYSLTPRLALSLSDTFIRNDAAETADPFGIRRGRQTYITNTASVAADWLLDRVALQAYYRNVLFFNQEQRNQDAVITGDEADDTITNIVGVNASARIGIDYIVRAGYEFSYIIDKGTTTDGGGDGTNDITNAVFASVARQFGPFLSAGLMGSASFQTEDNTKTYNGSVFGTYGLPNGLSISARLGYSVLTSDNEDNDGGFAGEVSASYRFANRAVISAGVFSDFRQSGQTGQDFGTVQTRSVFGSFLYQFTPFLNAVANVTYSENEPTGTGNTNNAETEKTLTYGASLNWQILRWLSTSIRYTYTKQRGTDAFSDAFGTGNSYAENRASIVFFAVF